MARPRRDYLKAELLLQLDAPFPLHHSNTLMDRVFQIPRYTLHYTQRRPYIAPNSVKKKFLQFLFVISEKDIILLLYPPSTKTKREPHTVCHAQFLKFVIVKKIVSRPYKNPRPSRAPANTPTEKKTKQNFWGSFHLSLGGDTALGVGDLDTESLGLGEDLNALAGRNGVGDPVTIELVGAFQNSKFTVD